MQCYNVISLNAKTMEELRQPMVRIRLLILPWTELLVWLTALLLLAFVPPDQTQQTLCVWHHLGVDSCPGCGLGHSMSEVFKGHLKTAFLMHPLGVFAVAVIAMRILTILFQNLKIRNTLNA